MKKQILIIILLLINSIIVFIPVTSSEGEGIFLVDELSDYESAGFDLDNIDFIPHIYNNEGLTFFYMPIALKKEDVPNLQDSDIEHIIYHGNQNFSDRFISIDFNIYESSTYWLVMYHMVVKASDKSFNIDFVPKIKGEELSQFAWWSSSWVYYRTLTISDTYIDTDLTNFPVLVNVSASISAKCSNGNSIRFLNIDNTTEYYYEIEDTWNAAGYNFVWVNITSISSSSDTRFLMYYGNSGASDNQSSINVWNSGYKVVSHLNTSDSTTMVVDSTSNRNNGTKLANAEPAQATGNIGYGQNYDGNDDNISYSNIGDTFWGFEVWIKPATEINKDSPAKQVISVKDTRLYSVFGSSTGALEDETFSIQDVIGDPRVGITENISASWHLLSVSWNGSGFEIYLDGVNLTEITHGALSQHVMTNLILGNFSTTVQDMDVDEFRVSTVKRNDSWMNAVFHSGNQTPGFLTFGLKQGNATVITNATTGIELTNATTRGYMDDVSFSGNFNYGFWIGQTTPVTEGNADQNVTGAGTITTPNNFSYNVLSLSEGTHYYVNAWVRNSTELTSSAIEDDFWTKCNVSTGFNATLDGCNVALAWTKGAGADRTTVVRKVDSYPTSQTDGTVVYNNTASSHSDTTASGSHQYYRVWSWAGDKHSDENASANLSVAPCPPTSVDSNVLNNNTFDILWTMGTGAVNTVVRRKLVSYPSSVTDGTEVYNGTGTQVNIQDVSEYYYYTLWSYANNTYSTSVNTTVGGLVINCYDEETNDSLYFDVFISNQDGSQTYESLNNTNPLILNISQLPVGDDIKVTVSAASNYSDKTETFTGYPPDENYTITYVVLLQTPDSKSDTNVTCINETSGHNSYPAFTLSDDLITILPDNADNFTKIFVNYTHEEYSSRLYYRDIDESSFSFLNTYLPPTKDKQLYLLEVIDEAGNTVSDAHIEVKRSVNGTFVIVSRLLTDANGQVDIDLISDKNYIFIISKTGYVTENASWTPGTDIFTHTFKIVWEVIPFEPDTFGDLTTFYGTLYVNNTMEVTFYDLSNNMVDSHFTIYENYNGTLTYMGEYNGTTSNDITFWINVDNATRLHIIVLYMNHSTLREVINYRIFVYPVHVDRADGTWLENLIISVVGEFDYGYVLTLMWVLPCVLLIAGLAAIGHPGTGIIGAGLYSFWITWNITLPEEAKILTFASIAIVVGFITLFLVKGTKVVH